MTLLTPSQAQENNPPLGMELGRRGDVSSLMGGESGSTGRGPTVARLTPHVRLRRVEAVVNPASGHVGPGAAEMLEQIVTAF